MRAFVLILRRALAALRGDAPARSTSPHVPQRRRANRRVRPAGLPPLRQSATRTGGVR